MSRRELTLVGLLVLAGVALRIAVTLIVKDATLLGDQPEYHSTGQLFTHGKIFWGTDPFGMPHESLWKAPIYGVWVGTLYTLLGDSPLRVELVQACVGGATIVLTWLLARRLFGVGVGLAAAALVTVYPLAWQLGAELYPEALAVPLVTFTLLMFLGREPTTRLALGVGALIGVNLLLRPSSVFLFAGLAVAFVLGAGLRRGIVLSAWAIVAAVVVVAPWTVRNTIVSGEVVPISIQDSAIYGTFNAESAADEERPWAWRPVIGEVQPLLEQMPPPDELELRARFYEIGFDYIADHPASVPKAFFWNGLTRFWDVRRPRFVLEETDFDGRDRTLTKIGLGFYWILLPLALAGLVALRRRRELLLPVLALAVAASVVYTVDSGTRYRAPLEPLIAILACSPFAGRLERSAGRLGVPAAGTTEGVTT